MTEIMPFPENNIKLFYWTAPPGAVFLLAFFRMLCYNAQANLYM